MDKPKPEPGPVPKPDFSANAPHPEDFAAWCEHPVTRFVAAAFLSAAKKQQEAWIAGSWLTGEAPPMLLNELRTRADAYNAFLETGLSRYVELLQA